MPGGIDVNNWAPPSSISDHGPLGPTRQWEFRTQAEFTASLRSRKHRWSSDVENSCPQNPTAYLEHISSLFSQDLQSNRTTFTGQPVTVYEWSVKDSIVNSNTYKWIDPPPCKHSWASSTEHTESDSTSELCRTESYQATKVSWANLSAVSPLLHTLASRIYLNDYDFEELKRKVTMPQRDASLPPHRFALDTFFQESACSWLRRNPSKWLFWTEGWNQKANFTIAWMSDSRFSGLLATAERAVSLVNRDSSFLAETEYALRLDSHFCQDGVVLNEYFKILSASAESRLIGTIAAIRSDDMESVVELSNIRKKLVISPTVATARFLEQRHYPYFFRTIPSMTQANYILLRLFLRWNWRRVVLFRDADHFFNPRLFQAMNIEIIADMQMDEDQLTYKNVRHSLENLKQLNSRIFVVEYEAKGTYCVLCAAYHLGMHLDAEYVWFLNPWLSNGWWKHPSVSHLTDCTEQEMANISSWTFTVGHQWIFPYVFDSGFQFDFRDNGFVLYPSSTESEDLSNKQAIMQTTTTPQLEPISDTPPYSKPSKRLKRSAAVSRLSWKVPQLDVYEQHKWYQTYTYDAVVALAWALVGMLKENPSVASALDQTDVAEAFRNRVGRVNFGHKGFAGFDMAAVPFPSLDSSVQNPLGLRFNSRNERVASHWVLKQNQVKTTIPIFWWSFSPNQSSTDVSSNSSSSTGMDATVSQDRTTEQRVTLLDSHTTERNDDRRSTIARATVTSTSGNNTSDTQDLLDDFASFERHVIMRTVDNVSWSLLGGPPHDGSRVSEVCAFPFLSHTLNMGCTGATVFVAICVTVLCLVPVILASLHYRRKLREAEKRTRKPFEELCAELADLDMPMEAIVLNRHIGQGAFGLVFGGEAKTNETWEAVAVKVLNEKATYEGKIDFLSEAKLMRSLEHRNVVRLIGISLKLKDTLYLIMELMLLGDLKTYLLSRRILAQRSPDHEDIRPSTLTKMSIDIAQGVQYLHSKNLIHRDIACRNCLVGSDHVVKLGDFGLTREKTTNRPDGYYRFTRNCELPIRWMSPEAVQYGMFSVQSDIWSYGITVYEIVTFGVFPYSDMGDVEVVERVKRMEFGISDFLPPSARNTTVWRLIRLCCQHQYGDRPSSMKQVLQVLYDFPECVRPFLTDVPPKPNVVSEQLSFQAVGVSCLPPDASVSDLPGSESFHGVGAWNSRWLATVPIPSSLSLEFGDEFQEEDQLRGENACNPLYDYPHRSRFGHSSLHNLGTAGDFGFPPTSTACPNIESAAADDGDGGTNRVHSSASSSPSRRAAFFFPSSSIQSPDDEVWSPLLHTQHLEEFSDCRGRTQSHPSYATFRLQPGSFQPGPSLNREPSVDSRRIPFISVGSIYNDLTQYLLAFSSSLIFILRISI
ncbi:insulin-like growth factor 1 receptor [Clonorchis sinensis]|uniref:Insulin-like growth factor 1 receptor n=1 Tax=Clonorchis sinensis TaxID=79923 RepID=G7Y8M2_CLOSI|nr:insulin-like growth factor 1 receptor [Clonorchis sinensis]